MQPTPPKTTPTMVALGKNNDVLEEKLKEAFQRISELEDQKMHLAFENAELGEKLNAARNAAHSMRRAYMRLKEKYDLVLMRVDGPNVEEDWDPSASRSSRPVDDDHEEAPMIMKEEEEEEEEEKDEEAAEDGEARGNQVPQVTSASRSSSSNRPISPLVPAVARPTKAPRYR